MDRGERPDLSRLRIPAGARAQEPGPIGCLVKLVVLAGLVGGALAGFLEADRRGYVPRIEPPKEEKPPEPLQLVEDKPRADGLRPAMAPVIGYVVARRKAAVGAARAGKIVEVLVEE